MHTQRPPSSIRSDLTRETAIRTWPALDAQARMANAVQRRRSVVVDRPHDGANGPGSDVLAVGDAVDDGMPEVEADEDP